jgi:hypothetical protein
MVNQHIKEVRMKKMICFLSMMLLMAVLCSAASANIVDDRLPVDYGVEKVVATSPGVDVSVSATGAEPFAGEKGAIYKEWPDKFICSDKCMTKSTYSHENSTDIAYLPDISKGSLFEERDI